MADDSRVSLADQGPSAADLVRVQLAPRIHKITEKLMELAELGDPRSIELVLKYWAPPPRPDAERVNIPGLRDAATILDKSLCVIDAVSLGGASVEAGEKLQRMLELHTKAVTLSDLAADVEALKRGKAPPVLLPRVDTSDLGEYA